MLKSQKVLKLKLILRKAQNVLDVGTGVHQWDLAKNILSFVIDV